MEDINIPITFDPNTRTFKGIKHTYKILESLPVCRFRDVELANIEAAFGCDVNTIINWTRTTRAYINNNKNLGEIAINAANLESAAMNLKNRTSSVFKIMDLWTVRVGEKDDLLKYGDEVLQEKIEDWAFIDAGFFLTLATMLIPNYTNALEQLSQSTSKKEKNEEAKSTSD